MSLFPFFWSFYSAIQYEENTQSEESDLQEHYYLQMKLKWENLCPYWYIQWLRNRLLLIFLASLKTELQMELMKSNKTIGIKYIEAQITWFMCTIYVQRERNFKTDEGGDVVGDRSSREGRLPILGGMIKYYDNHPGGNDKNLIQSSWGEW